MSAGLLERDAAREDHDDLDVASDRIVAAAHRRMARTPSRLFAVRLDDLVGERSPVNLPGTVDQYPNWQLRLSVDVTDLPEQPLWRKVFSVVRSERPGDAT